MTELTAQEMVDWANANMERVEELEAKIERLHASCAELRDAYSEKCADNELLRAQLESAVDQYRDKVADNELLRAALDKKCNHVWTNEFGLKPFHCIWCGTELEALAVEDKT